MHENLQIGLILDCRKQYLQSKLSLNVLKVLAQQKLNRMP